MGLVENEAAKIFCGADSQVAGAVAVGAVLRDDGATCPRWGGGCKEDGASRLREGGLPLAATTVPVRENP